MNSWYFTFLFRLTLSLVLTGIQYFLYARIQRYFRSTSKTQRLQTALKILFIAFNLPLIVLICWQPKTAAFPGWLLYLGVFPFYLWHFCLFIVFIILVAGMCLKLPFTGFFWLSRLLPSLRKKVDAIRDTQKFRHFDQRRRAFIRNGLIGLTGAVFAETAYSTFEPDPYQTTFITIPIRDLPGQFEGFSITLISDIHSSVFMTKEMILHYIDAVNRLRSDLIVIPGDFVTSQVDEVYPVAEAVRELKAPFGVYGVLGNHDFYTKNPDRVAGEISASGITMLRNEYRILEKGDGKLYILGVDDFGNERNPVKIFKSVLQGSREEIPKVLLCHRPYYFPQAAEQNIDLTLSGHTHGGQIIFVKIGRHVIAPASLASPYVSGFYALGHSSLYVSRGIGTVGIPLRLNCPPEITQITLRSRLS